MQIRSIHPGFDIGETTRKGEERTKNTWEQSYRHWKFVPKSSRKEERKIKPRLHYFNLPRGTQGFVHSGLIPLIIDNDPGNVNPTLGLL